MGKMHFFKFLSTIFILLFFQYLSVSANWNFNCIENGEVHGHERMCSFYYECIRKSFGGDWKVELKSCPPGRIFNVDLKRCVDGICNPVDHPCEYQWDFKCKLSREKYVHDLLCKKYYECEEDNVGQWMINVNDCPFGFYFDDEEKICKIGNCPPCKNLTTTTEMSNSTETTTIAPPPFKCTRPGTFPDILNCNMYHTCTVNFEGNLIHNMYLCQIGENFYKDKLICDPQDVCPCT